MGADAGFDMVPCLSRGGKDKEDWDRFIQSIKAYYKGDPQVEVRSNYIEFIAGEHPRLPFEGHKLLRFSSKITGNIAMTTNVESYINVVTRMAKRSFGSRVQCWNELVDEFGHHGWNEVYASMDSYEHPDEPELPSRTGTYHIGELDHALFEIRDIPGKGRGLVARFDIAEGTRILCEKPLFIVESTAPERLQLIIAAKLKTLSKEDQRRFLSLHNNFPGRFALVGIVRTNGLPCGCGASNGGVYPTISFINHSCLPNTHNNWNPDAEHETIHAVRPIPAGEEITIAYDSFLPFTARQAHLKKSFGFDCECRLCSLSAAERRASDNRRLQIKSLDEAIGDPLRMALRPEDGLRDCYSMLRILREEFDGHIGTLGGRLYYDAFQICISHGDEARAGVLAERAYILRRGCEGEDSCVTQRLKSLSLNPAKHESFAKLSRKWKLKKSLVPKGLDTAQMEKWLFRL